MLYKKLLLSSHPIIKYPQPIPGSRWRSMNWIHNSRYDVPELSSRDFTKGLYVGSATTYASYPDMSSAGYTNYNYCCGNQLQTGNFDWGLGSKSFIFTNFRIRKWNPDYNVIFIRRSQSPSPYTVWWHVISLPNGKIQIGANGCSYVFLNLGVQLDKWYQLGFALDRTNLKYRAALTEHHSTWSPKYPNSPGFNRTEVEGAIASNWKTTNITGAGYLGLGGWPSTINWSTTLLPLNGYLGSSYIFARALEMKEL